MNPSLKARIGGDERLTSLLKINAESLLLKYENLPPVFKNKILKILHMGEIDEILTDFSQYENWEFVAEVLDFLDITIHVEGLKNLPDSSKNLFVANHPLGGLDGLILLWLIGDKYQDNQPKVIANSVLSNIENMRDLFISVDVYKHRQRKDYVTKLNENFNSSNPIIIFPSGEVSRRQAGGEITDSKRQNTALKKAIYSKRNIVPVYFDETNSKRFYNIAQFRKLFHLPNIEMFLLIDEVFRKKGQTINLKIGPIIQYDQKGLDTDEIRKAVYGLAI